jgi:nitroimidazol reductase NimA-like FMN-containing flavoprotein (pyridoxamine 5'-phosphate oxidase superfamily)
MHYSHDAFEEMSPEETTRLLQRAPFGRLGLAFENEAYVVPVYHIYDGKAVRFSIGAQGKKTTYLQANPQACFEVDEITNDGWCSVICYGSTTLSDSTDSKRDFLKLTGTESITEDELQQLKEYICTLVVDEVTGRKSRGYAV